MVDVAKFLKSGPGITLIVILVVVVLAIIGVIIYFVVVAVKKNKTKTGIENVADSFAALPVATPRTELDTFLQSVKSWPENQQHSAIGQAIKDAPKQENVETFFIDENAVFLDSENELDAKIAWGRLNDLGFALAGISQLREAATQGAAWCVWGWYDFYYETEIPVNAVAILKDAAAIAISGCDLSSGGQGVVTKGDLALTPIIRGTKQIIRRSHAGVVTGFCAYGKKPTNPIEGIRYWNDQIKKWSRW
jgi:hypothetical protein